MFNFVNTGLDDQILKSLNSETPSEDLQKAMNKQGLVQKEIQVKGKNGQTFTRKQWVKASEEQKTDGNKATQDENPENLKEYKGFKVGQSVKCDQIKSKTPWTITKFVKDSGTIKAEITNGKKVGWAPMNSLSEVQSSSNSKPVSSSHAWTKAATAQEAKKQIADLVSSGKSKQDCISEFKAAGATWKESDHEGINWMRACMAMNKQLMSGQIGSDSVKTDSQSDSSIKTDTPKATDSSMPLKQNSADGETWYEGNSDNNRIRILQETAGDSKRWNIEVNGEYLKNADNRAMVFDSVDDAWNEYQEQLNEGLITKKDPKDSKATDSSSAEYKEFSDLSPKSLDFIKSHFVSPHKLRENIVQHWEKERQQKKHQTLTDMLEYSQRIMKMNGETYWVGTPEQIYEEYSGRKLDNYHPDLNTLKKYSVDGVVVLKPKKYDLRDDYYADDDVLSHPVPITDKTKEEIHKAEKEWREHSLKWIDKHQEDALKDHDNFIKKINQTMKLHDQFGTTPIEPGQAKVGDTVKTRIVLDNKPVEVTGTVTYIYTKKMQDRIAEQTFDRGIMNSTAANWRTDAGSYGGDGLKIKWDLASITDSSLKSKDLSLIRYHLKENYTQLDGNDLCLGNIYFPSDNHSSKTDDSGSNKLSDHAQKIIDELQSKLPKDGALSNGVVPLEIYSSSKTASSRLNGDQVYAPKFNLEINKPLEEELKNYAKENGFEVSFSTSSKVWSSDTVGGSKTKKTTKTRTAIFVHIDTNKKFQEHMAKKWAVSKDSHSNDSSKTPPEPTRNDPLTIRNTKSGRPYQIWKQGNTIYGSAPGKQDSHVSGDIKDFSAAGFSSVEDVQDYVEKYF